jgi:branched-chain amino acid transport system permease protein
MAFETLLGAQAADSAGPALASILIYVLMAAVLFFKPHGLFPSHG